jgi:hypothetical protein
MIFNPCKCCGWSAATVGMRKALQRVVVALAMR